MYGKTDFEVLWEIGAALLSGENPYGFHGSWYPPAATILFSIFALIPVANGIWLWRGVLLVLLAGVVKRDGYWWILYLPLFFVIIAGQVDLVLVALIPMLNKKGWKGALAAFVFTLKPITAVVILPWFILKWLREEPRMVSLFLAFCLLGHTWPLLVRPTIFSEWGNVLFGSATTHYFGGGLWSAKDILPTFILATLAAGLVVVALVTKKETLARSALALASPFSLPYHHAILTYAAPGWIMALSSIVMVIIVYVTNAQFARVLVPLTAFLFNLTIPATFSLNYASLRSIIKAHWR